MISSRFGYTLLLYALLPRALAHLLWRARRQRAYLEHLAERFGRYAVAAEQPLIWVHAVSVGDLRAATEDVADRGNSFPAWGMGVPGQQSSPGSCVPSPRGGGSHIGGHRAVAVPARRLRHCPDIGKTEAA